jgi:hypothetical protein
MAVLLPLFQKKINICNTEQHMSATSRFNIHNIKTNVCTIKKFRSNFDTCPAPSREDRRSSPALQLQRSSGGGGRRRAAAELLASVSMACVTRGRVSERALQGRQGRGRGRGWDNARRMWMAICLLGGRCGDELRERRREP